MTRMHWSLAGILAVVLLAPAVSRGQVAGFSPQQQASLYLYQQQAAQQARMRQQQQLQAVQRQFIAQRQQINRNMRIQQRQLDAILNPVDPHDPNANYDDIARSRRGTAIFGDPHYGSSLFNRLDPYYDYAFIARRNRPAPVNIGASGSLGGPSSGFGGLIVGGGFGAFAVPF